jgi:hypothetical protein
LRSEAAYETDGRYRKRLEAGDGNGGFGTVQWVVFPKARARVEAGRHSLEGGFVDCGYWLERSCRDLTDVGKADVTGYAMSAGILEMSCNDAASKVGRREEE